MHSQIARRLLANAIIITANLTFFSSKKQQEYLGFKNLGNTCYMYFFFLKKYEKNCLNQEFCPPKSNKPSGFQGNIFKYAKK